MWWCLSPAKSVQTGTRTAISDTCVSVMSLILTAAPPCSCFGGDKHWNTFGGHCCFLNWSAHTVSTMSPPGGSVRKESAQRTHTLKGPQSILSKPEMFSVHWKGHYWEKSSKSPPLFPGSAAELMSAQHQLLLPLAKPRTGFKGRPHNLLDKMNFFLLNTWNALHLMTSIIHLLL